MYHCKISQTPPVRLVEWNGMTSLNLALIVSRIAIVILGTIVVGLGCEYIGILNKTRDILGYLMPILHTLDTGLQQSSRVVCNTLCTVTWHAR